MYTDLAGIQATTRKKTHSRSRSRLLVLILISVVAMFHSAKSQTEIWTKAELSFISKESYDNPLYQVKEFYAVFISPTGKRIKINGFWDGANNFKIRFSPDELGAWTYSTYCSKETDTGLHGQEGRFECIPNKSELTLFRKGAIQRVKGQYHLSYADGTPFFFTACTAWNGALMSTEAEWDKYLKHRVENNYNVIQFVSTQWGHGRKDLNGEVAFTGSSRIKLNPVFFQRMDKKIDRINSHGLVAAPVLLWALPVGDGSEFHPGYYLPDNEAILLAKYIVARYGGHQVIWILGGDGQYTEPYTERWKNIGRSVFGEPHPGVVAQHPRGKSWIGEIYKDEHWLDIVGYQSGHRDEKETVDWINKGPVAGQWDKLPPRPLINMEPNYEEITAMITDEDVRNASYWSIFSAPLAGITYGANGIWPWVKKDASPTEKPGAHRSNPWFKSIDLPGSMQIGYLSAFIQKLEWWTLKPAAELLTDQPGDSVFNDFVSIVANDDRSVILAYTPSKQEISIRIPGLRNYDAVWFDPIKNQYTAAALRSKNGLIKMTPPSEHDYILILRHRL